MNRLAVSIVILCVMIIGCFAAVYATCVVTDKMSESVNIIEQAFVDGDKEKCVAEAENLENMWQSMLDYSILINDLGHAVEITSSIAEIRSFSEEQDEELYTSCDRCQAQIEMLRDMQLPTIWKIL